MKMRPLRGTVLHPLFRGTVLHPRFSLFLSIAVKILSVTPKSNMIFRVDLTQGPYEIRLTPQALMYYVKYSKNRDRRFQVWEWMIQRASHAEGPWYSNSLNIDKIRYSR